MRCYSIVVPCDCHLIGQADPRPLRRHCSGFAILLSTPGIQKMDVDGDGGRRESGLRGQRRGTESDKGTAANSLSGYHAPGLKKISFDGFRSVGRVPLMICQGMNSPPAPHRDAELLRYLHLRRAGPIEAIPVWRQRPTLAHRLAVRNYRHRRAEGTRVLRAVFESSRYTHQGRRERYSLGQDAFKLRTR